MNKSKRDDFSRGYYCAVAALLSMHGQVTTEVRELYKSGGNPENADESDKETFRAVGLTPDAVKEIAAKWGESVPRARERIVKCGKILALDRDGAIGFLLSAKRPNPKPPLESNSDSATGR